MPRRYIVQPPEGLSTSPFAFLSVSLAQQPDPSSSGHGTGSQNTASRSSEAVRVCNPCVPDPNFSPPTQTPITSPPPAQTPHPPMQPQQRRSQDYNDLAAMGYPFINTHVRAPSGLERGPPRIPPRHMRPENPGFSVPSRASPFPHPAGHPSYPSNDPQQSQPLHLRRATMATSTTSSTARPPHTHPSQAAFQTSADFYPSHRHHASHSQHRRPPLPPHLIPGPSSASNAPQAHPPLPPQPRREIQEEDECPVCTQEMPPIGPNGDESARLKHVEDCIKLYSTSAGSGSGTLIPAPNPSTTNNNTTRPLAHTISASAPSASSSAMPPRPPPFPPPAQHAPSAQPATVPRNHRLLRYVATEKDCVNASGEQQECVICMEDFEPGIEMGRLDCFCAFHEACIKEWWGRKGVGSCPTHQVTL